MATITIDDFEDGDITVASGTEWSGWSDDTDNFTASTDQPLSETYSGRLTSNSSATVRATRSGPVQRQVTLEVSANTGRTFNNNDSGTVTVRNTAAGEAAVPVTFRADQDVLVDGTVVGSWDDGVATLVQFYPRKNGTVATYVDGTQYATTALTNSSIDEIEVTTGTANFSDYFTLIVDDVRTDPVPLFDPSISIDSVQTGQIDIGVTLPTDADALDLYRSLSPGITKSDGKIATASTADPISDTSVQDGTTYYYAGVALDTDGDRGESDLSAEISATTDAPPPTIDSLTAASPTQIDGEYTLTDSNTTGEVEILVDGTVDQTVTDLSVTTFSVTGLTEATKYEIGVRRVTGDGSTSSASANQFTEPNAPGNGGVEALDGNDVTLGVVDNSANESGYRVLDSTDGGQTFSVVNTTGANAAQITAPNLSQPDTHTLAIQAVVGAGASSATSTMSPTVDYYLPPARGHTRGATYAIEITHANGNVRRVEPDDAQFVPRLNRKPRFTATVGEDESWVASGWDDAMMKAWKDGRRLPIDTLVSRPTQPGQTQLVGVGGSQLDREADWTVDQSPIDDTLRDLVGDRTDYLVNVDDPSAGTEPNTLVQEADSVGEFQNIVVDAPDDVPVEFPGNGNLARPAQTCFLFTNDGGAAPPSGDFTEEFSSSLISQNWEDGDVMRLDSQGDHVEFQFDVEYTIPASRLGFAFRREFDADGATLPTRVSLDGITLVDLNFGGSRAAIEWGNDYGGNFGIDLSPANNPHTLRFELDGAVNSNAYWKLDVLTVFDTDYHTLSNFPNQVETDSSKPGFGFLPGPAVGPSEVEIQTSDAVPPVAVSGARVEADVGSTYTPKQLELSGDSGGTWPLSATDTESLEGDFASLVGQVRSRITLGAAGEGQSETPIDGYARPSLLDYQLFADLDETPLFVSENFQGSVEDVANTAADRADALWEIQWDAAAGKQSFEYTRSGGRPAVADAALADFDFTRTTEERRDRIRILGGLQSVREEPVTADHGTAVALGNGPIKTDSETVEGTSATFVRGQDYEMTYPTGEITTLASGSISDGQSLVVSYQWQPLGEADRAGVSAPYTVRKTTLPELSTDTECELVARRVRDETAEPLEEAEIQLPPDEIGLTAIDNLQFRGLPSGDFLDVNEIDDGKGGQTARLGSRRSVDEVLADIQQRVSNTAENA
jgi:hypothetical protein